jgi:flagellar biosynthesis protein FlhF
MDGDGIHKLIIGPDEDALVLVKSRFGDNAMITGQRDMVEIRVGRTENGEDARTYLGTSLVELMAKAFSEIGRDAVVVSQRDVVELRVAAENSLDNDSSYMPPRSSALFQKAYGSVSTPTVEPIPKDIRSSSGTLNEKVLEDIYSRLNELQRLARSPDRPTVAEPLEGQYFRMIDNDVTEDIARHLVEKLQNDAGLFNMSDPESIRNAMLEAISRLIPVEGPIKLRGDGQPTVVMIVGPTGVGKTTSIAKLAMKFKISQRCRVKLITEDTTRPGAEEQLQSVAQLLSIPLTVADTVERMRGAIQMASDRDVILIDTAGRVPKSKQALDELAHFIEQVEPDEVHLALSSLSSYKQIVDTVKRFDKVKFDKIIFTKIDEATTYGLILNVAAHIDRGVSYITTGQDYMENLEEGDSRKLAELILSQEQQVDG